MNKLMLFWLVFSYLPGLLPQSAIAVTSNQATLNFPDSITFSLDANSDSPIESVVLQYRAIGQSCQDSYSTQAIDFDPAAEVSLTWDWEFKHSGSLPPGTQIEWQWEIRDTSGATMLTDKQTLIVEDNQFAWRIAGRDGVFVYWVTGNQSFGNGLLELAVSGLDRLATNVGMRPAGDVRINVYPDLDSLRATIFYAPEWLGGVAYSEYRIVMTSIAPGEDDWAAEVIPHELAHLVTGELTFNCYGAHIPTWLEEGLAVYAEGPTSDSDIQRVKNALKNGDLEPLHNLTSGFPAQDAQAALAYAQSGQVVGFMVNTYGAEKMSALLAAIKSGETFEKALGQVYDLETDELDSAWRVSLGFAPLPTSQPTQPVATVERTAVPTLALWTSVVQTGATATIIPTEIVTPTETLAPTDTPVPPTATPPPTVAASSTPAPTQPSAASQPALPCAGGMILPLGWGVMLFSKRFSKKSR